MTEYIEKLRLLPKSALLMLKFIIKESANKNRVTISNFQIANRIGKERTAIRRSAIRLNNLQFIIVKSGISINNQNCNSYELNPVLFYFIDQLVFNIDKTISDRHGLVGKKFNRWTVIKDIGKGIYLAKCDCGREFNHQRASLVNGLSKECIKCSHEKRFGKKDSTCQ